ncbi:hypothetical protein KsCSTR_19170 [Candidatus Kuenenia stuttgartiensis]|uniref:Uncharacterized protein n=1 Tax=Kuenenia stuttgartiensis TaxID=174633 RepID=Q1Q2G8_KUEST|nr:hypothetical protein KsCSTR_19170 [Candidatus Kuenenia stuttgartiensis]CAJ74201.1 unknown protein [Candidatus Kuenenia stuttgartiensis]
MSSTFRRKRIFAKYMFTCKYNYYIITFLCLQNRSDLQHHSDIFISDVATISW